jgi:sulfite reductase beta subunit-like hemoprotein
MSAIASLYNVPTTPGELATWSFLHAAHHTDINRTVMQAFNIQLPAYILDPLNADNMQVWLDQHQALHSQMDFLLGINGFNLDSVNWRDENERAGWIWLNAQEHYQAAAILEIG